MRAYRFAGCFGVGIAAAFMTAPAVAGNLAAVPMTVTPIYMGTMNVLGAINAARSTNERVYGHQDDRRHSDSSTNPVTSSPATASASTADFSIAHAAAVSAEARQVFLDGITQSSGKAVADQVDQQLGTITDTFSRMVTPFGLHVDDFADVMTAYTVVIWMAANRQTNLPQIAEVQGVRQQLRGAVAGKLDDPRQRQLVAETMMYQTCMLVALREQAQTQGRPDLLDTVASSIDRGSAQNGELLRSLALTEDGLVPR